MLNMLKYYRKGFLSIIKSEFADIPELWSFDVKGYSKKLEWDLNAEERSQILENNKKIIGDYIKTLDTNSDGNLKWNELNNGDDFGLVFDTVYNRLWLDTVNLDNWFKIDEIVALINNYSKEKDATIKRTNELQSNYRSQVVEENRISSNVSKEESSSWNPFWWDEKPKDQIASTKVENIDVEKFTWAKRVLAELLNKDTNWFFSEELSVKEWPIWPQKIMKWVHNTPEEVLLWQIQKLNWQLKWSSAEEILKNFDDLSWNEQDKIKTSFVDSLENKLRAGINIKDLLNWKEKWWSVEKMVNLDVIKNWVRQKIEELDQKISSEKNPEQRNKLISERAWIIDIDNKLWNIRSIDAWFLIKWDTLNSVWLSGTFDTWFKNITITSLIWTDWRSINWWANINIPLFWWENWWVWASLWATNLWVNWWVWFEWRAIEWTKSTEFSNLIDGNWNVNLDWIVYDKNVWVWVWVNAWLESWGLSYWWWAEMSRNFKWTINRVADWFRNFIEWLNITDEKIKVWELNSLFNNVDPKNKQFINEAIKDISNGVNPDTVINSKNLIDAIARKFSNDLNNALIEKWWDLKSFWLWVSLWNWWIIPWLLWRIALFSEEYNQNDQTNFKLSEHRDFKNIVELREFLNNQWIDWVNFISSWKDKIQIIPKNWVNVLDKLNICVDKANINEFVWHNNWIITVSTQWLELFDAEFNDDDNERRTAKFLSIWWATTSKENILKIEDLWWLWVNPKYSVDTETKTDKEVSKNKIDWGLSKISEVDNFIKDNLSEFQWIRQANKENYVDFNENLDNQSFEEARTSLIKILENKSDKNDFKSTESIISKLNKLDWVDLWMALAQMKIAFMLDKSMFYALNDDKKSFNKDKLLKVVNKRVQEWHFKRMFDWLLNTENYENYGKAIISSLEKKGSNIEMVDAPNMFSVVATYPAWVKYAWMDLMPAWVAKILWWEKVRLAEGDNTNKNYIIDKVARSPYWDKIIEQINSLTKNNLIKDDLRYLLRWESIKWVKVWAEFFAFLNWICANESLGMEISWITIEETWNTYSMDINEWVIAVLKTVKETNIWTWVWYNTKEENKTPWESRIDWEGQDLNLDWDWLTDPSNPEIETPPEAPIETKPTGKPRK